MTFKKNIFIWSFPILLAIFLDRLLNNFSGVIILVSATILFLIVGNKVRIDKLKILFFNLSAILFALFIYEFLLFLPNLSVATKTLKISGDSKSKNYAEYNKYLGYGAKDDGIFVAKLTINKQIIYDVFYTTKNGLRFTPNSNEKSSKCALFFGGSFTYGEGLNDSSTLPYFFNEFENQKFKIYNYGFPGYGPQQMLSLIENHLIRDTISSYDNKIAVYILIPDHFRRAAGYSPWDQYSLDYEIINGKLVNEGSFSKLPRMINKFLMKFLFYRKILFNKEASAYDVMRTLFIIKTVQKILIKKGIAFYLFIWDDSNSIRASFNNLKDYNYFIKKLKDNKINFFLLSKAIPDYNQNIFKYSINNLDLHPNVLANRIIAKYIASGIVKLNQK
jgi:hypothetical protein